MLYSVSSILLPKNECNWISRNNLHDVVANNRLNHFQLEEARSLATNFWISWGLSYIRDQCWNLRLFSQLEYHQADFKPICSGYRRRRDIEVAIFSSHRRLCSFLTLQLERQLNQKIGAHQYCQQNLMDLCSWLRVYALISLLWWARKIKWFSYRWFIP